MIYRVTIEIEVEAKDPKEALDIAEEVVTFLGDDENLSLPEGYINPIVKTIEEK